MTRGRRRTGDLISIEDWWDLVARRMSEKAWQEHVREAFKATGWDLYYHTHISAHSPKGFPDVAAAKYAPRFRVLFAELKREGEEPTPEQQSWLDALGRIGPPVECYVWKPSDRDSMLEILLR